MLYFNDEIIGLNISRIGLGAARMGSKYDEKLSFEMLDIYEKYGGNFIDTARNYYEWISDGRGKSENLIGNWMNKRSNRDKLCILTKGGTHGKGSKIIDLSESGLLKDAKESMEALQTDRIDIYALHRDDESREIEEIMYTLQKVIEIANVKRICADCWNIKRIIKANNYANKHNLVPFTVVETWWSLAEYTEAMWDDPSTTNMTADTMNYILENDLISVGVTSQCKGFFQKAALYGIDNISPELRRRIATERNIRKLNFIKDYCCKNGVEITAFVNSYISSSSCKGIGLVSCSSINQLMDILKNSDYILPENIRREVDTI